MAPDVVVLQHAADREGTLMSHRMRLGRCAAMRRAATIAFLVLAFAPAFAHAQTPEQSVATAARILLSVDARDAGLTPADIVFQSVVVSGKQALVDYSIGKTSGLIGLADIDDWGWTLRLRADPGDSASDAWFMEAYAPFKWASSTGLPFGPSPAVLREAGFSQSLIDAAERSDPYVKAAAEKSKPYDCHRGKSKWLPCFEPFVDFCCPGGLWEPPLVAHDGHIAYAPWSTDGWGLTFRYALSDAPPHSRLTEPTPLSPSDVHRDILYARKMSISAPSPVSFRQFTVDLWCPYVLDPAPYRLRLYPGDGTVIEAAGSLRDNALHFALPALTIQPNTELLLEVAPYTR